MSITQATMQHTCGQRRGSTPPDSRQAEGDTSWGSASPVSFLAVGSFTSAISKNQIVAFVVSLSLCFVLVAAGFPLITEWAVQLLPEYLVDTVSGLSFFTHYLAITKGVLDLRDLAYFIVVIVAFLTATGVVIQSNR